MDKLKCNKESCTFEIDGKCVEENKIEECPHLVRIENTEEKISFEDSHKLIYDSDALTTDNCNIVTSNNISRIVILAGPIGCGKTTLICCLNQLFQQGTFSNYIFKGSYTLLGFEKITHDSRPSSGRTKETTAHTTLNPLERFFHLSLMKEGSKEVHNLLLSDISGEHFKNMKDSVTTCKEFSLLKRADHFALFFDCEKICDEKTRQSAHVDSIALLQTCIDAGMLNEQSNVEILFSKWDKVTKLNDPKINAYVESIKGEIKEKFSKKVALLKFFNICSRPDQRSSMHAGFGINLVLPIWLKSSSFFRKIKKDDFVYNGEREFLKFGRNYHG